MVGWGNLDSRDPIQALLISALEKEALLEGGSFDGSDRCPTNKLINAL